MAPYLATNFGRMDCPYCGDDAMNHDQLMTYCEDVLYALADRNPARYKQLYDVGSRFWERGWHVVWRKQEFERMFDTVSSKCKG